MKNKIKKNNINNILNNQNLRNNQNYIKWKLKNMWDWRLQMQFFPFFIAFILCLLILYIWIKINIWAIIWIFWMIIILFTVFKYSKKDIIFQGEEFYHNRYFIYILDKKKNEK